jgi:hypothetical protein
VDGHLAVVGPDGTASRRRRIERLGLADRYAASRYTDELPGGPVSVRTASVLRGGWEFRIHRVTGPGGYAVREGGYALAADAPPAGAADGHAAVVRTPAGLTAAVVGLYGWSGAEVVRYADANAYGRHSATGCLRARLPPSGRGTFASLIVLTGEAVDPAALRRDIGVSVDGDRVTLRLPDGKTVPVPLAARDAGPPPTGAPTARPAPGR